MARATDPRRHRGIRRRPDPRKVNLGVGVYYDDAGKIPLLECVRHAESERLKNTPARLSADRRPRRVRPRSTGISFDSQRAILSPCRRSAAPAPEDRRRFLRRISRARSCGSAIRAGEPPQLFEAAGFTVSSYPYYDAKTHGLDFAGMQRALGALPAGSIVVLHACCHNPTGVDLDASNGPKYWTSSCRAAGAVPRSRLPGLRRGLEADGYAARLFAAP